MSIGSPLTVTYCACGTRDPAGRGRRHGGWLGGIGRGHAARAVGMLPSRRQGMLSG
jgi:hypothetical protein